MTRKHVHGNSRRAYAELHAIALRVAAVVRSASDGEPRTGTALTALLDKRSDIRALQSLS